MSNGERKFQALTPSWLWPRDSAFLREFFYPLKEKKTNAISANGFRLFWITALPNNLN